VFAIQEGKGDRVDLHGVVVIQEYLVFVGGFGQEGIDSLLVIFGDEEVDEGELVDFEGVVVC
jgi:hypothetical protein